MKRGTNRAAIPRFASPRRKNMTHGSRLSTGRRNVLSLFVLALATAALIGSASPANGSTALGTTTTLGNDVVHYLSAATLLGPVPASQQVTVGVVLNGPNQAAEDSYLAQLYNPNSTLYQQFLDPDTFNQQFGVPATTVQAAQTWLTGAGLQVSSVEGATTYLLASGTAAQISAAFATPMNRYSDGGRTFYANAIVPTVPASLPISTVLGLNDYAYFVAPTSESDWKTRSPPAKTIRSRTRALITIPMVINRPAVAAKPKAGDRPIA